MSRDPGGLYSFEGRRPVADASAFIAPGARVIGRTTLSAHTSVWFNAVLRADYCDIEVGEGSNVQDLTMVHVEAEGERGPGTAERGVRIGRYVTVGHSCVIHSCSIEDDCMIGMQATIMSGVVIGRGSIVGAGSVVLEDTVVPPFSLVAGNPARVRKTYPPSIVDEVIRRAATMYVQRAAAFRAGLRSLPPD